jgi:subtilisin family serine protease
VTLLLGIGPFGVGAAYADPVRDKEYPLRELNVSQAWRYAIGAGVVVAVLDSGVDAGHPDLVGQVLPGADFVDGSTDGRHDFVGHGTTVAALIAGHNDDAGVAGLAPGAKILPIRVLDATNRYDDANVIANGLRWAVDHGARVVNISLGGSSRSDALADALEYARVHDVVVIACTGNVTDSGVATEVWYPAREAGVVAVAGLNSTDRAPVATRLSGSRQSGIGGGSAGQTNEPGQTDEPDRADEPGGTGDAAGAGGAGDALWNGSLTGPPTVLAAPAVNIVGARPGGYWLVQGTSFAAPLVTATAALIRSRWPNLDAANVINRLIRTARDLGSPGRDDRYGYGEVDPVAALTAPVPVARRNPLELVGAPAAVEGFRPRTPPTHAARAHAAPSRSVGSHLLMGTGVGSTVFIVLLTVGLLGVRRFGRRHRARAG